MNENPLLNIVQELRSKELNSLDQLPVINDKLNLLIINCLHSFLRILYNIEKTHLESEDGKPDLSRISQPQLSIISDMLRDDIKVINEFLYITNKMYVQDDEKIIIIVLDRNCNNLEIVFRYVTQIDLIVKERSTVRSSSFCTETKKRSEDIFLFYSQIVEKIIERSSIGKKFIVTNTLSNINLDEEEISIRTAIAPILDSIEKFIKLFSNHIYISKIQ